MKYQVMVKWNREFHYVSYQEPFATLKQARNRESALRELDGVKDTQILNLDTGKVV